MEITLETTAILGRRSLLHSHMAEPKLNGSGAKAHKASTQPGSALRPLRSAILDLLNVRRRAELHADSQVSCPSAARYCAVPSLACSSERAATGPLSSMYPCQCAGAETFGPNNV